MKIGELARATLTPLETIRFYEREGLLPHAARTEANYRIYDQQHVQQLTFIRHCRTLDMALDEIRALLRFKASPQGNCAGANELLDEHIGHVAQRIHELRSLEKQLKLLRHQCVEVTAAANCGILKELSGSTVTERPAPKTRRHVHGAH